MNCDFCKDNGCRKCYDKEEYRDSLSRLVEPLQSAPEPGSTRRRCLETALKYTQGDRNAAHGDPENNFTNIARFWNAHLVARYPWIVSNDGSSKDLLDATDVAIMMAAMKMARLSYNPAHEDSWIDLAGYAACGMEIALNNVDPPVDG